MGDESAEAIWYCVVVRDGVTKHFRHYRCLWNRRDAEIYKLQLEQAGDQSDHSLSVVTIETLPAGEVPQKTIQ
jgi:hypothetical protein